MGGELRGIMTGFISGFVVPSGWVVVFGGYDGVFGRSKARFCISVVVW